ncbi:omega-3 polyunsaturated fatty acid synthase PfaB [Shewanella sairae]|uniref:Omega-3 polyunsaturated fatty acid synthase PfaB n=1 Tax=Shewanella sairae TaxID=190310 RepID=A0ABQ4PMA4_9GAMM|nr:PfaB family protein [Shewanella sairae]GIU49276.1 omega-3 polyunsaturated fatty acid synthase PfaB [Shewanella sairae]
MEQTPKASVMPLRIALILLPAPQMSADSLSALLPELATSGLLSFEPSSNQQLINIIVDDANGASEQANNRFEQQLQTTVNAINDGKLVLFSNNQQALLMLPALKAAQLRLHPHAVLSAMQTSAVETNSVEHSATAKNSNNHENVLSAAFAQAKRELNSDCHIESYQDLSSAEQFSAVYQLIEKLATRTHHRNPINQGVALGPKQAKSHFWFSNFHQARVAAISFTDNAAAKSANDSAMNAVTTSYVLTQGTGFIAPKSLLNTNRLMFILAGQTQAELKAALDKLSNALTQISSLEASEPNSHARQLALLDLMQNNLQQASDNFQQNQQAPQGQSQQAYQAVLQASSIENLQQELDAFNDALANLFADASNAGLIQYKTPAGSYFSSTPLAASASKQAGLAFVYPGVGTVYADMLSELHQYFPALYARLEREGDLKSMLQAEDIYHLDPKHAAKMSLGDLAIAGVGSSYLLTQLLVNEFNIQPDFALGYSMGEASMWASLGVWENPHALINKTQTDPLFTSAISGKLTAVRQAWQLTEQDADIVWNSFVVRSEAAPIQALLNDYPRAYLAIIQGDTCVIAGCEQQCKALLAALGKRGIAANRVTAMHTQPAMQEHCNVQDFYQQPLKSALPSDITFISAADLTAKQTVSEQALSSQVVAQSIANTFCQTLDFTALVHHAQNQGAKLFVEVGADRQNCTLIDKIAKQDSKSAHQACCTVPVNAKGSSDVTSLLKALGQLISHNVPMSLQPFIDGLKREQARCQLALAHDTVASSNEHHLLREEV